jgi:hypothetical protein
MADLNIYMDIFSYPGRPDMVEFEKLFLESDV